MLASLFLRRLSSPPLAAPPPYDRAIEADEPTIVRAEWTAVRLIGKRLNRVCYTVPSGSSRSPLPPPVGGIVLGDSYADDVDMRYFCWPSLMLARSGRSALNAARGGSEARHGIDQHERALAFAAQHDLRIDFDATLCIVHLGGNDLLHALWLGPLALAMLWIDVALACLALAGLTAPMRALPRVSFFGVAARRVAAELSALVRHLSPHHRRVLVSGLPVCAAVPTCQIVVGALLLPVWLLRGRAAHRQTASAVLTMAAALGQALIFEQVAAAAAGPTTVLFFDEAAALEAVVAQGHGAEEARRRAFRDTHHPLAWVHEELAAAASEALRRHGADAGGADHAGGGADGEDAVMVPAAGSPTARRRPLSSRPLLGKRAAA